jgi:uncharacterized protein YneR
MGLDMYLYAKKYVGGWAHTKDTSEFDKLARLYPIVEVTEDSPSIEIQFTVGYWRKANAIHNWFVKEVQGGKDECVPHYVERSQLEQLRDNCKLEQLVTADTRGAGLLEPASGFFFGNAERDEWYYDNLNRTIEIVEKCLLIPDEWSFEYRSSW